jgi:hypothetical protein
MGFSNKKEAIKPLVNQPQAWAPFYPPMHECSRLKIANGHCE